MYDVLIIGAGVSGCAIARELSRYQASVCVLEKGEDVCSGTSKANSAIVHAGFDAQPGSLMAKLNVEGAKIMPALAKELDFPYKNIGSLVVCTSEESRGGLQTLLDRGQANGVPGLRIVEREELLTMEPNISDQAIAALYAPTAGIVCPFNLTIALAENACMNGAEFFLNTCVEEIRKEAQDGEEGFTVIASGKTFRSRVVVNAAGVYAGEIHNMVSEDKMTIIPRKGEYCLLDKSAGAHVNHTIFALPTKMGKGILVTPTVHGNLLLGPTAEDIGDPEGTNTTGNGLEQVQKGAALTVKNIPMRQVITSFAGLRAHHPDHDFKIGELKEVPGFVDCAAIESPGLSSAPAIGRMVAEIVRDILQLEENEYFIPVRRGPIRPAELSMEERNKLIEAIPAYGNIICRCEMITEGEILDAIHRPLGARSLDAIKRRTRAGMGRCQAGFCSPRTMEILSREVPGLTMETVTKCGGTSKYILGYNKDRIGEV